MATIDQPVFILSAPCSGATVVHDALRRASGVHHSKAMHAGFLESDSGVDPAARGWESHRLAEVDLRGLERAPAEILLSTLVDREGKSPDSDGDGPVSALATGSRLALRVPLLEAAFPDARFVVSFRDPADAIAEMLELWRSRRYVLAEPPPAWEGQPWSLPLIEGWRELSGKPLEQVVTSQWLAITQTLLDDVEQVPGERWAVSDFAQLLADPRAELQRLCGFLDIHYDQALLTPVEAAARQLAKRPPARIDEALEQQLARTAELSERWQGLIARDADAGHDEAAAAGSSTPPAVSAGSGASPFRSVSTHSFAKALRNLRSTLVISTYQSGKLIAARHQNGLLNTHFRDFDKPMGIAVGKDRFALASRTEVWDFRDMGEVAAKLEPKGSHDACYLPRNRHVTGDALMHELAFAGGELWGVATRLSCLVTFDREHSLVPRWRPPFISEIASGDRCHLNGLCVVDDQVRYVTALGTGNEPGSWREDKANGGVIMEVPSGEFVCTGLSMPHSPRVHEGQMYVLESGKGELVTVDRDTGATETVVEVPGFTRGFAIAGRYAFIGLSQIRESSTFGDLPITQRLTERICGVWMVDLKRGEVAGFLRFDDLVQEIFDVSILEGVRFPEIAEAASTAVSESFALP